MNTVILQNTSCGQISATVKRIYLALAFLITLGIGVLGIVATKANFIDMEGLANNLFAMGNLHFDISAPAGFTPQGQCGATQTRNITIVNQGNPFRYKIKTANVSGALCPYLTLRASLDGVPVCSGSLAGFVCDNQVFPEIGPGPAHTWTFLATYGNDAPSGSACAFDFVYSSWQMTLSQGGFSDEQTISNVISAGNCGPKTPMIINKIYYDVASSGKGTDPDNEWIELYNPNAASVNLKGWKLCSQWSCETVKYDSWILSHGYAVVSRVSSTWNYWPVPAGVIKINDFVEGTMTIALDNDNGLLFLKDPDGLITDQMNYGTPSTSWPLYNANVWNPGVVDGGQGHALGRYPSGTDTNTAADWKDYAMPSVTITSTGTNGMYISGKTYAISWSASNPSGPDDNLLVDLYYVLDTNDNNAYDSTDQTILIASSLPHSGSRNLTITGAYHFFGYVWIKAIVRNTDNFMVSATTRSCSIFEPDSDDIIPPDPVKDLLDDLGSDFGNGNATSTATSTDDTVPNVDDDTATSTDDVLPDVLDDAASTTSIIATSTDDVVSVIVNDTATSTADGSQSIDTGEIGDNVAFNALSAPDVPLIAADELINSAVPPCVGNNVLSDTDNNFGEPDGGTLDSSDTVALPGVPDKDCGLGTADFQNNGLLDSPPGEAVVSTGDLAADNQTGGHLTA